MFSYLSDASWTFWTQWSNIFSSSMSSSLENITPIGYPTIRNSQPHCGRFSTDALLCRSATSADLLRTANFAAIKHRDQRRKDAVQTPYINHPIGVAAILAEEGEAIKKQIQVETQLQIYLFVAFHRRSSLLLTFFISTHGFWILPKHSKRK